ncbi:bifunctional proline dehydrogenase/L-glutamate gamma-semialdehyde dehydrogenase [Prosthecobacter sp.]|uniref:bifunctional proline dehydrogenase/L-glutamate gamma-semialdehyde dehydrogenase n=1 Tax=Prosthecobacter sp. TaxID=1965333 RepID=UPI003783F088
MNSLAQPARPSRATPPSPTPAAPVTDTDLPTRVSSLAEVLLTTALHQQTAAEHAETANLGRLMNDPTGKAFTFAMVDEVFRSHDPRTEARRWRGLLTDFGIPKYPPLTDRLLMRLGALGSHLLPGTVMQAVAARMRADSARVILPGEKEPLRRYLTTRAAEGFRINLNHLGEAVLGEEEAAHRLAAVLAHLADDEVNYISVKISAIFSQINLIAWDDTLASIKAHLRTLYRAAAKAGGKFVNLDMEEYRDLALTVAAFRGVLDEPEFLQYSAGIVLQAYLPDSCAAQRDLTEWSIQRVARGGAPIKIRLVKGANLAMENVEAELHGWFPAPYPTKADTDANFRRLMEYGCQPAHAAAVRLGVASHNLFDVALALTLREQNNVTDRVEIEMLEGMANHQARAVRDLAGSLLLYAPAVQRDDFLSAMAYLVRRLDENTAPENFLRDMFAMRPGSAEWEHQHARFIQGWHDRLTVSSISRRIVPAVQPSALAEFKNEPDTDWTQPINRTALTEATHVWHPDKLPELPSLESVLHTATQSQPTWESLGVTGRAEIINRAADLMSAQRFTALACLNTDGKKAIADADGEVSEAIDFARYYARNAHAPHGTHAKALGIVAVVSPWNFPYAIPAGGILAALMAGNTVIFKPARATSQIAFLLARQLWQAGVPRDVLQFFPCDSTIGEKLITDPRIQSVILTGGYETARKFQNWRPSLHLLAETSGKNALVITAQADRELAIKDLVRSAFGHSGQKCSAASLAILEGEIYDDPAFRRQLRDAAASLHVGPATDRRSIVTPLVIPPGADLHRALTKLDAGEEWLLEPKQISDDPCLWTPGIKLGVRPGSWFHLTECFGPVLGLMRAESLPQATTWQNATAFGLTAGLHSLDPDEVTWWREHAQAGNLYINRPITGAIVQRQPFGGWKKSCIGPGAKAGGPNYVLNFCHLTDTTDAKANVDPDYLTAWQTHFSIPHDPSALRCESNIFRYRACRGVILRLDTRDETTIARARLASQLTGAPLTISIRTEEPDADFISRLPELSKHAEFLRTTHTPSDALVRAAHASDLNWINAPLLATGRIELTRWLREQSVSETRHRYGQLPDPTHLRRGR